MFLGMPNEVSYLENFLLSTKPLTLKYFFVLVYILFNFNIEILRLLKIFTLILKKLIL